MAAERLFMPFFLPGQAKGLLVVCHEWPCLSIEGEGRNHARFVGRRDIPTKQTLILDSETICSFLDRQRLFFLSQLYPCGQVRDSLTGASCSRVTRFPV